MPLHFDGEWFVDSPFADARASLPDEPSPEDLSRAIPRVRRILQRYSEESPAKLRAAIKFWKGRTIELRHNKLKGHAAFALAEALDGLAAGGEG